MCPVRPIGCRSHGSRRRRRHLRRVDPFTIRTVTGACTMKNFGIRDALFGTVAVVALYGAVPAGAGQIPAGTEAVAALTDAEHQVLGRVELTKASGRTGRGRGGEKGDG